MLRVLLQGILLGIVISISPGPSLFALIQIGIQRKLRYGIAMSAGITLSDLTLIIVSYYGLASYINTDGNTNIIGTVGGTVLIIFGIYSIFSAKKSKKKNIIDVKDYQTEEGNEYLKTIDKSVLRKKTTEKEISTTEITEKKRQSKWKKIFGEEAGMLTYFFKGYFINILNPVVLILWAGAVVTVTSMSNSNSLEQNIILFFAGSIGILLIFNVLKVLLGKQIKNFLKPRIIELINIIIGIIFVCSGIGLIINVLFFL